MFTAGLFTVAKIWKQTKCPLMDEWIKMMWYIHIYVYTQWNTTQPLKKRKKEILPFATMWLDLEGIMLSEISQAEKDKYCMLSLICGI